MSYELVEEAPKGRYELTQEPEADTKPSFSDRLIGRPMTKEQKEAADAAMNRGWGTGWAPFAEQMGGKVTDAVSGIASPGVAAAAGGITNFALNAFPMLSGGSPSKTGVAHVVRNETIEAARDAGYVIPPTATGGGAFSKAVESIGGKAAIGQEASIRNQQVTNELARKAASLAPDEAITEGSLAAAREPLAEPYREISEISARAKQALEKLQDARLNSKDAWKAYNVQGGATNRKTAEAADSVVDTLERVIEKEASAAGVSGLVDKLRAARKAIAKNFDVERALNVGTGDVDAHAIGRLLDKRGADAVTGELGTIGKFALAFKQFSREAPAGQSAPGVSKLTPYAAMALGLGGYSAGMQNELGPWGAAAAMIPLLSGPARALALSKAMQSGLPAATTAPRGLQAIPALLPAAQGALYK